MAAAGVVAKKAMACLCSKNNAITVAKRCLSSTLVRQANGQEPKLEEQDTWYKRLFVRKIDTPKESQSHLLSDRQIVYELQFHSVKPDSMEEYLKQFKQFNQMLKEKNTGAELVGSWTVEFGNQDEAIHLWKYGGGYELLNQATEIYRSDKAFIDFRVARNKMLRARRNQICLSFSFWPFQGPHKEPQNIYELRSYTLKPGTMIEWGNHWARGLQYRKNLEQPIAGLFSHIGEMYTVHHIWAYKNLQTRKEQREAAWSMPGWDECVAYTVPLLRTMNSRILIPTPFSPLQ